MVRNWAMFKNKFSLLIIGYECLGPCSVSLAAVPFSIIFLRHKPLVEKHSQPHFSQLSNDTASQSDQTSINNR